MAGRPYKSAEERRRHQYRVRLNDAEWSELQYLKEFDDFKISDFLRKAIHMQYIVKNGLKSSTK